MPLSIKISANDPLSLAGRSKGKSKFKKAQKLNYFLTLKGGPFRSGEGTWLWSMGIACLGTNKRLCSPQGINPASLTSTKVIKQINRWMYECTRRKCVEKHIRQNILESRHDFPIKKINNKINLIPVSSQRTCFSLSIGINQFLIDLFRNTIDSDDSGRAKPPNTIPYWHAGYHGPHSFSLTAAPVLDAQLP